MKELTLNTDLLRESGIPKPFFSLGADTYQGSKEAQKKIERYIRESFEALNDRVGIFLSGPRHTCKTFLATFALKCLMSQGYDVKYVTLDRLTAQYFEKGQSKTFADFVEGFDFIAIDNCDSSGAGEGDSLALDSAVRLRKDEGSPIFIISSLSLEDFESRYRDSTYDYVKNRTFHVDTSIDPVRRDRLRRKARANWG